MCIHSTQIKVTRMNKIAKVIAKQMTDDNMCCDACRLSYLFEVMCDVFVCVFVIFCELRIFNHTPTRFSNFKLSFPFPYIIFSCIF